jgi:dephospho-CoA kinase
MFIIGLTGGIGSGKTEVARILKELGAETINADETAHAVYRRGTDGWRQIVEEFGEDVLAPDGEVDRGKLGSVVFSDERALAALNSIVHPPTRLMIGERVRELGRQGARSVVIEVPLLVEAIGQDPEWMPFLDEVWVTVAPENRVVERILGRDRLGERAVRARIQSQTSEAERLALADAVIDNSGNLEQLGDRVRALWQARVPQDSRRNG